MYLGFHENNKIETLASIITKKEIGAMIRISQKFPNKINLQIHI